MKIDIDKLTRELKIALEAPLLPSMHKQKRHVDRLLEELRQLTKELLEHRQKGSR